MLTDSDCYSVLITPDEAVWAGCNNSLIVFDSDTERTTCVDSLRYVTDMALDGDYCFVTADSDKSDATLVFICDWGQRRVLRSVREFPRIDSTSSLTALNESISLSFDRDSHIHKFKCGLRQPFIHSRDFGSSVDGLCYMADGSLMVSNAANNQVVRYDLETRRDIWDLDADDPEAISVTSDGLIYVGTLTKRQVYVISPDGMAIASLPVIPVILRLFVSSVLCAGVQLAVLREPKIPTKCGTISVRGNRLAIACRHEKQVKIFNITRWQACWVNEVW